MTPIWKDMTAALNPGAEKYVDYLVQTREGNFYEWETIYAGRAYADPFGDCYVTINEICADHLKHIALEDMSETSLNYDTNALREFRIYAGGEAVETWQVWNCWDYVSDLFLVGASLNRPISGETAEGVPVILSDIVNAGTIFGTTIRHQFASEATAPYDKVVDVCNPSALIYYNSLGGWDMLLLKGGTRLVTSYDRKTIGTRYDNSDPANRGKRNYQNVITEQYDCFTGWLQNTDNIGELFGSVDVYLWDLEHGSRPVVLLADEIDVKKYRQNGRPAEYSIRVGIAQDKQRR